jgi:tRNA(fMet)-specific endonuclease VapC
MLDTDTCIFIRQRRPEQVLRRFQTVQQGEAVISTITFGELLYGAAKTSQPEDALRRIHGFVGLVPPLPVPENAAETYGLLRAELEAKGQIIGNNDLWIAAHALTADLILVTNNEKEFRRVRGLKLQNWTA